MLNKVIIMGNLTKDPELRYTQTGTAVATVGVAVNETYKEEKKAHFFNVVCWNKTAELVTQYLVKGSKAIFEGSLQQRTWQTQDGQNRSVVEIRADRVHFVGQPVNVNRDDGLNQGEPQQDENANLAEEWGF